MDQLTRSIGLLALCAYLLVWNFLMAYPLSEVFARGWQEIALWALFCLPVLVLGPGLMRSASCLTIQTNNPLWGIAGCLAFFTPLVFGMAVVGLLAWPIQALGFVQKCAGPCPATAGRIIHVVVVGLLMALLCVVFWRSPLKTLVYNLSEAGFVAYVFSLLLVVLVPAVLMRLISTGESPASAPVEDAIQFGPGPGFGKPESKQ